MKWVTRAHVHIDRVACPWLIKRFIDTEAEFLFVAKEHVNEIAKEEDAIPFDSPGVALGHHEEHCSFISFLKKYKLTDPALWKLGELVDAADTDNFKGHAYASCLNALAHGFSMLFPDDLDNVEQQFVVYDALYNYFRLNTHKEEKVKTRRKEAPKLF